MTRDFSDPPWEQTNVVLVDTPTARCGALCLSEKLGPFAKVNNPEGDSKADGNDRYRDKPTWLDRKDDSAGE